MRTRIALMASFALLAGLLAGCGEVDDVSGPTTTDRVTSTTAGDTGTTTQDRPTTTVGEPATTSTTVTGTTALEDPRPVSVFFLRGEELMVGERRQATTVAVLDTAMRALLEGPTAFETDIGLRSEIPDGTRLLDLDIDGSTARVDLSGELEAGGGSLSMQARVAQIVYTATQFTGVDDVRFLVDGAEVDAIGGEGIVVDEPLGRDDFEVGGAFGDASLVPSVLVTEPLAGDPITSPVRVTGSANVFEATFGLEVVDGDGLIVASETVTATSGSGDRGSFDVTVRFEPASPGLGAIITFVESARDGSRQDVREIPVRIG